MAEVEEYENIIKSGEDSDLGAVIQNLIDDNLRFIHTSYLATITSINGNKVSIKPVLRKSTSEEVLILNNCLIAYPYSNIWRTQFKVSVGDIGIALVIENDISSYKQSGTEGVNQTKRFKDFNDSIFIPLSLYKTETIANINYKIVNSDGTCNFEFTNENDNLLLANNITSQSKGNATSKLDAEGNLTLQSGGNANLSLNSEGNANLQSSGGANVTLDSEGNVSLQSSGGASVTLDSEGNASLQGGKVTVKGGGGTLMSLLNELASELETLASGTTGPGYSGVQAVTAPSSIGKFSSWASKLSSVFKE